MKSATHAAIVGVYTDATRARQAIHDLRTQGFNENQIGVVAQKAHEVIREGKTVESEESKMAEGLATGAVVGAGLGSLVGLAVLAGVIPVIGPVIAGGTLAVILANAAGGAAVAGIVGGLIGLGIPEEEAKMYEKEVRAGKILIAVQPGTRYEDAYQILRQDGAVEMKTGTLTAHA